MTTAATAPLASREPLDAVVDVVSRVREAMAELAELPAGDLTPSQGVIDGDALDGLVGEVAAAASQLGALKLRLARLAEATGRPDQVGATGADAWLARLTGTTRARAAGGIWLARVLEERYPGVRDAFAAGDLDEKRARIIVRAAETIPADVTEAQRAEAVASLVERTVRERLNPTRLPGPHDACARWSPASALISTRPAWSPLTRRGPRTRPTCGSSTAATAPSRAGS